MPDLRVAVGGRDADAEQTFGKFMVVRSTVGPLTVTGLPDGAPFS
jgi:hypothetical protein